MQGQLVPFQVRHPYRCPVEEEGLSRMDRFWVLMQSQQRTKSSQTPSHLASHVMSNKCTGLNKCSLLIAFLPKTRRL